MELVEGEPLTGPVPYRVAVDYARQIALALDVPHEKGIVHRDLKSGQLRIRRDGTIKVLDLGLAKMAGFRDRGGLHAIADDGRAWNTRGDDSRHRLFTRRLDESSETELPGTQGARMPFFSLPTAGGQIMAASTVPTTAPSNARRQERTIVFLQNFLNELERRASFQP